MRLLNSAVLELICLFGQILSSYFWNVFDRYVNIVTTPTQLQYLTCSHPDFNQTLKVGVEDQQQQHEQQNNKTTTTIIITTTTRAIFHLFLTRFLPNF